MGEVSISPPPTAALVHSTRHTAESEEPLSTTIASALAAADGVDPTETAWALTDYVDPEALDSLFLQYDDRADCRCRFEFAADDYRVVVVSDGSVSVFCEDASPSSQ